MRVVELTVEPFGLKSYLNVECIREINTHGILKITGMIASEKASVYRNKALEETWVLVKAKEETGKEVNFFYGILTNFSMKEEGQVHIMTIEIRTGSYLLDLTPHIRSFQENTFTYNSVVKKCLEGVNGDFISSGVADEAIGGFLLQYNETDWEFFKRLACRAGTVLIPEFITKGKKFYFGCQNMHKGKEIKSEDYVFDKTYEEYGREKKSEVEYASHPDYGICRIHSREFYHLGEFILFMGRTYQIGKIVSQLEGEELVHEYFLIRMREAPESFKYNENIRGLSLKAFVKQVKRDKVQVTIQADENKAYSKNLWFDYATVYTTPDGTGWYCMPEPQDEVRLTFPDDDEKNAYVASSVHLEAGKGRSNPDEKSWKNKQNKEILFTPDALILRNNKGLLMELSDKDGIKIISDKGIVVDAVKDVQITSKNAGVSVKGKNQIGLSQGCAQISIADEINIAGGKINMN